MALAVLALEMAARLDGVVGRGLLLLQLGDPLRIGGLAAAGLAVETVDEAGIVEAGRAIAAVGLFAFNALGFPNH
jgi:hypothetical protein